MHKPNLTMLLGTFVIAIAAFAIPSAAAAGPTGSNSNGLIVFKTGSLTGEFAGNVPHIRFYATNEFGRTVYQVNFRALIEFSPGSSGNGVYESPLMVGRADFDSAQWTPSNFYSLKDQAGTTIGAGFNFTLNGAMQIAGGTGPTKSLSPGDVMLGVKAYNTTRTITVNGQKVTITTAEIKIDFSLKNWPFASTSDKLALQVNMHSDYNHFDLDEAGGAQNVDATHDEGTTVTERDFHETSDVDQQVRFSAGPVTSSMNIGFFHFVNTATVTTSNGQTSSVPVAASYKGEKEGNEMFFKLYLAYPSFPAGATLVHDPSIGLAGGLPTLYLIVGGVAVAGLAAVVVIRRRHPQVQKDSKQN